MAHPLARTNATIAQNDGLYPPSRPKDARSLSNASFITAKPAQSYGRSAGPMPGSFMTDLKSFHSRPDLSRQDSNEYGAYDGVQNDGTTSEQRQAEYIHEIEKQTRLKAGTENLLEALSSKNAKKSRDQRLAAESQLNTSTRKIAQLKLDLEAEIQRSKEQQPTSSPGKLSQFYRNTPSMPAFPETVTPLDDNAQDPELESPSYILAEILQALEQEDMSADYYVNQANALVELFRRHPALKYDLAWSIFGLRVQVMLLSDSREVVAAGYRVIRYAIADRKSLQAVRALQTDYLVILSLVKESKARVEREQALKFIRAFLNVKDGTREVHPAVARIVVAVADHTDDQLRNIAILTLAEMLLKDPALVVNAGGVGVLADAMASGVYRAPETLLAPFLYLMDLPAQRGVLRSGFEFSSAFATFTEPPSSHLDEKLAASSRVVAGLFKSWAGLMVVASHDFLSVRSIVSSLFVAEVKVKSAVLDLLNDILRLEKRSWSTPFIGGRRLTTYARAANLNFDNHHPHEHSRNTNDDSQKRNLVKHFTAVTLAILLKQGLMQALIHAESFAPTDAVKRRTNLIIAEVLKLASELLPASWSTELQILPRLFDAALRFENEERSNAVATVYQVDKVNLQLWRSEVRKPSGIEDGNAEAGRSRSASKSQTTGMVMDETTLRQRMLDSGVLSTSNYNKWDWNIVQELVETPLENPKLLYEAMERSKFVHRLFKFLRPFHFRFSDASNTKASQRYVRMACSLAKTLLRTPEGANYLLNNKTTRQLAECLAQLDTASGITSKTPMFSPERLAETLVGGYFTMLGVMCTDPKGLQILERWHIINMFYHIIELKNRDDLIRCLLTSLDYSLDSHPRIILSKALIAASKSMRIMATKILRKYAIDPIASTTGSGSAEWAIKLLVSQLYDPEIEVCEVAIKILEEACNDTHSLEFVVKCRPALDHLGEIGAPLLLRFLSTSVGYRYLDGLDYITREMDDWFLGRNDSYVIVVEASLARALADQTEKTRSTLDENLIPQDFGFVPPHFYRELTRTAEGCNLLAAKRHFEDFTATIQESMMEEDDQETIVKVKGCLWAVGNVGSMELGAPFLERSDVVKYIVRIAETSRVMSLRGTAFFVLGLISRSLHGQEILAEHGWDGTANVMGESLGYVLPLDLTKLFSVGPFPTSTVGANTLSDAPAARLAMLKGHPPGPVTDGNPQNVEILAMITKLGNTVLTNKAIGELNNLRHVRKATGFSTPALFRKAMVVLASHAYRVPQYRFVIDLFDKSVLRAIVLEEESSEEEVSSSGEDEADGQDETQIGVANGGDFDKDHDGKEGDGDEDDDDDDTEDTDESI